MTAPENAKNNSKTSGYFPSSGYMTADEIAFRLRIRSAKNLKEKLREFQIPCATVCSKTLYRCEDLERLFFDADAE